MIILAVFAGILATSIAQATECCNAEPRHSKARGLCAGNRVIGNFDSGNLSNLTGTIFRVYHTDFGGDVLIMAWDDGSSTVEIPRDIAAKVTKATESWKEFTPGTRIISKDNAIGTVKDVFPDGRMNIAWEGQEGAQVSLNDGYVMATEKIRLRDGESVEEFEAKAPVIETEPENDKVAPRKGNLVELFADGRVSVLWNKAKKAVVRKIKDLSKPPVEEKYYAEKYYND
jgi:hypothetical protein